MPMYEQKPRAPTTDRTTSRRPTWEGGGGGGEEEGRREDIHISACKP